ncbi:Bax inhibitor-1/YccA family protein [uncultured Muribaculum sp.]|uniref:Bax inhibitor-1/YccA family protein n=1 Tax=uncultured Muribaculum sp. TaxID=1918613 RepID=UPI0025CED600|nr:Bax inhibitor-1/YccA family protein [uncultured Muribaculum sp.]
MYPQNYNNYGGQEALDMRVSQVMRRVYLKMFLALLVTTAAAFMVGAIPGLTYFLATHTWVYWGLLIVELVMVYSIAGGVKRMSSGTATGLFYLYAVLNGVVFSLIFAAYSFDSIFKTFLITAGTFGAMSVYGYFTSNDLTKIGSFLYMALFGLIICIVVNIFWANSTLDWIISAAGVLIFIGLTAYDTQKVKEWAEAGAMVDGRLATIGALTLYLDFINLFLYLLRFFGSSRD